MRRSSPFLLLLAFLLISGMTPARAGADQPDAPTNIGETACSDYIQASNGLPANTHLHTRLGKYEFFDYSLRVLDWMTGYIVSFKLHTKVPAVMVRTDYRSIDTFLRTYCTTSPQANFQSAADIYIQQQIDNTI